MEDLFRLIGLALPDTPVILRLKLTVGGLCGLGAGLLFMTTGLEGSLTRGGMIAACGLALIAIAARGGIRPTRPEAAGPKSRA
jgi:hypothetical protein